MIDKYWFSSGGFIDIQGISISPNKSAKVQALCFFAEGIIQMKFIDIEGDEYLAWGNDDNYLIALVGHKLGMGIRIKPIDPTNEPDRTEVVPYEYQLPNVPIYIPRTTYEDTRSIHNDNDLARISSLETELEEQRKKLATIMSLLGKSTI